MSSVVVMCVISILVLFMRCGKSNALTGFSRLLPGSPGIGFPLLQRYSSAFSMALRSRGRIELRSTPALSETVRCALQILRANILVIVSSFFLAYFFLTTGSHIHRRFHYCCVQDSQNFRVQSPSGSCSFGYGFINVECLHQWSPPTP